MSKLHEVVGQAIGQVSGHNIQTHVRKKKSAMKKDFLDLKETSFIFFPLHQRDFILLRLSPFIGAEDSGSERGHQVICQAEQHD